MQYVSKVVSLFGSYYGDIGINEANSTGATDIVVVEQMDGSYQCTPFHVRFGKLNILRPKEVIVDLYVNNEYVKEIEMRVEPTGQAYFEVQKESFCSDSDTENENATTINDAFISSLAKDNQENNDQRTSASPTRLDDHQSNTTPAPQGDHTEQSPVSDSLNDPGYRSDQEGSVILPHYFRREQQFEKMKMSLCGNAKSLVYKQPSSMDKFNCYMVSYEDFVKTPVSILNDPNLVILHERRFYEWKAFSVIMLAQLCFQKTLDVNSVESIVNPKKPEKTSSRYKFWGLWSRDSSANQTASVAGEAVETGVGAAAVAAAADSSDAQQPTQWVYNHRVRTLSGDPYMDSPSLGIPTVTADITTGLDPTAVAVESTVPLLDDTGRSIDDSAVYLTGHGSAAKSNFLPSDTLKLLKLKDGFNELFYVITGKYRGTITVGCKIYLWKWSDQVVISDIDGTITKSDVWGHLSPLLGVDWTQAGIVALYNALQAHGYRLVYLSARPIGQAERTRRYLASISQGDCFLPDGPILLAPSSMIMAFRKEVIEKHPEEFKIHCLTELKAVFPANSNPQPLYAGFGNRGSDEFTYRQVGVPEGRIFTVDPHGRVTNPLGPGTVPASYEELSRNVHKYFPVLSTAEMAEP